MNHTVRLIFESAFWVAAGLITYTYIGYPLFMYLRSRLWAQAWKQAPIEPSVSIIMAVHNGATLLRQKIEHLLSLDYPEDRIELIVVSDGSSDESAQILQGYRHPRLKAIVCEEHRGKAAALNCGISRAAGELLVFVDIRPWLDRDALRLLVSNFADSQVGCAGGALVLQDARHDAGSKAIGGLYWRYEQWIRTCEAKVDSPVGVYGGFYAIRRELARLLPDGLILDDMAQPLNIVRQGYRSVLDERARVNDAWPPTSHGEFVRKVRTLAGNFQLIQLEPWLLSRRNPLQFELISHKLLRLIVPVLLMVALASSATQCTHSLFYLTLLLLQFAFYSVALLAPRLEIPTLRTVTGAVQAFCLLNVAVIVGCHKFLFANGPLWKIWVTNVPLATPIPASADAWSGFSDPNRSTSQQVTESSPEVLSRDA